VSSEGSFWFKQQCRNVSKSVSRDHEYCNEGVRMRYENTKLSESIKAVTEEMSVEIEFAYKNSSESFNKTI
jgi:hypothetical protein